VDLAAGFGEYFRTSPMSRNLSFAVFIVDFPEAFYARLPCAAPDGAHGVTNSPRTDLTKVGAAY
jgi:hypothetical protein